MKRAFKHNINHCGFTMIEMVVVLIVMAIVATFILAGATPGSNTLIVQAEVLKSHLRYAQIRAMNDTAPWGIHIPDAGSYRLYRNNALATSLLPGETAQTHTLPTGITVTVGVGTTFSFNEWGTPVNTGSPPVPIASTQTITLSQGSTTNSINITQNTGYIP